jgi:hypothetical protein
MRESSIERALVRGVQALGGRAWKWVSPGHSGVPDRIVTLRGRAIFVELKAETGRPTPLQLATHDELRRMGMDVRVLRGRAAVEDFLEELRCDCRDDL